MLALQRELDVAANDALSLPLAPTLRLMHSSRSRPDWQVFTRVLHFLMDARDPTDLAHRAAASLGLLPQVAWTDLDGDPPKGRASLAIRLERGHGARGWLEVGLVDPDDDEGRAIVKSLLSLVAKFHAREIDAARLSEAAYRDPLTGLWNRRGFQSLLEQALAQQARHGSDLALLVCDVDRFKRINDEFGHAAGDVALMHVARAMETAVRPGDVPARLGGDELVILLASANAGGAKQVAARLRAALRADNPLAPHPLTLSVGIADHHVFDDDLETRFDATPAETLERRRRALFDAADRALYRAKTEGRDRACVDPLSAPPVAAPGHLCAPNNDPVYGTDDDGADDGSSSDGA